MEDTYILRLLNPWNAEDEDIRTSPDTASNIINDILDYILSICKYTNVIKTKSEVADVTRACRDWVLFFTVLYNYNMYQEAFLYNIDSGSLFKDNSTYLDDWKLENIKHLTIICKIIIEIYGDMESPYFKMFYKNKPTNLLQTIRSLKDLTDAAPENSTKQWTLCINNNKGIFHFFLLLKLEDEYYISSSYGSEHITVSQYTTKLTDIAEFEYFCAKIDSTNEEDIIIVKEFIKRYFLLYNKEKRIDEDELDTFPSEERAKRWSGWITPEEGVQNEIDHLFKEELSGEKSLHISLITGYETYVIHKMGHITSSDGNSRISRSSPGMDRGRSRSRSRSPGMDRGRSRSRSPGMDRGRSRSRSPGRGIRGRSRSPGRGIRGRSRSPRRERRGRSRSPRRDRRISRSRSPGKDRDIRRNPRRRGGRGRSRSRSRSGGGGAYRSIVHSWRRNKKTKKRRRIRKRKKTRRS